MNKLKQIAFILVLALSLTTFAACGKNNKDMNNGTNNHSVTENGTDKNGANNNNIVDDNATTDSNGSVNDRSDTNGIDYGTTGENMRDAAENAKVIKHVNQSDCVHEQVVKADCKCPLYTE